MESIAQEINPPACNLAALSAEQRARHAQVVEHFFTHAVEEVEELPDGFAFRAGEAHFLEAAEFVSLERLCCPFLDFSLSSKSGCRTISLSIRGLQAVKAMLRSGFARMTRARPTPACA